MFFVLLLLILGAFCILASALVVAYGLYRLGVAIVETLLRR